MTGASRRDRLHDAPWKWDVFELLRELERSAPDKPRIGAAARRGEEIVEIRQDPFLAFPSCNVTRAEPPAKPGDPEQVFVQFMGFFGPQGPLPLTTTLEAYHWIAQRDDPAFARFADMFSNRFVQLFYRAWADARPVVQMGRPAEDRFRAWTGALIGVGTPGLAGRDTLPDDTRRRVLGLWGSRVRSAARLIQILREVMAMDLDLDERVGSWLEFSPDDHSRLGGARAALGRNCCLGARAWSVSHKIRVTLHCRDLAEYERCLPGRAECTRLGDLLRSYLGPTIESEIALTLPAGRLPPTRLGQAGQLGWTSFALPPPDPGTAPGAAAGGPRRVCAVFPVPPDSPANSDRKPGQ